MAQQLSQTMAPSNEGPTARLDFAPTARKLLDLILVQEPELPIEGLFRLGGCFFIVSPSARVQRKDGKTFQQWFAHEVRPVGTPIELIDARPNEAEMVPALSEREVLAGFGEVRTRLDLARDLALALPSSFPLVGVRASVFSATVLVNRPIETEEEQTLKMAFAGLGCPLPL